MKSKNPVVSVLLPIGKDKRFLSQALESVRSQTFKEFELLSREDDGKGVTRVLNDLAKKAKGEFLARMDADDICLPERLKVQTEFLLSHPDVQLIGSWATLIDENGNRIGLQKMPIDWEEIKKDAFYRNPIIHPSWMMRKSWFEKMGGYNSSFKATQDWELILRTVWKDRVENIPEPLIKLRIHSGSVSFSNNRNQVYFGLKARLSTVFRGDVPWYKAIYLTPSILSLTIPTKLKLLARLNVIPAKAGIYLNRFRVKHGMTRKQVLGLVMPMGQNKDQLTKSGQWSLWQFEIDEYKKYFNGVEVFEFKHRDWRRFFEAKLMPLVEGNRFRRCSVLKAVHLSAAIPCLAVKFLYGIPYVLSFGYRYDEFARIEKKWLQWIFIKLLEPLAVWSADLVLVPTEDLRKYVKSLGAKNIKVIPNGVDIDLFKPVAKSRFTIYDLRFTIFFVGRLEKQKNLKVLIEAVSRISKGQTLPRQGLTLIKKLLLVGAGGQKDELVALADQLEVNLEIIDRVPNEKLPEIYRQADIFVLPSLAEGHPKALLEAMSCGLACIATDVPGPREIITGNKNGLLVQPTVEGLSAGLSKMSGDKALRKRLGEEARKTILEKFDKKKLMEAEIKSLLSIK